MLYNFARSVLFSLDPEVAHDLTLTQLQRAYALGLTRFVCRSTAPLPVTVMGLAFPNPVGLAAGMDKNGDHIDALGSFGFGFIEAGTVTPRPQPGNPKPRIFRLIPAQGVINRMGFNNDGVDAFVENVKRQKTYRRRGGILGLNIGKNADTPIERALDDYVLGRRKVYEHAEHPRLRVHRLDKVRQAARIGPAQKLCGAVLGGHKRQMERSTTGHRQSGAEVRSNARAHQFVGRDLEFLVERQPSFDCHQGGHQLGDRGDRQDGVDIFLEEHLISILIDHQRDVALQLQRVTAVSQPGQLALGWMQRRALTTGLGGSNTARPGRNRALNARR